MTTKYIKSFKEDVTLSNILAICFILHQFGYNYHISFGSVGLLLISWRFRSLIKLDVLLLAATFAFLIILSGIIYTYNYGYSDELIRVIRFSLCAFLIYIYMPLLIRLPPPNYKLYYFMMAIIMLTAGYQLSIDRSLQVPRSFYAFGENLGIADSVEIYDYYKGFMRINSIYSEPSVFGMVLVFSSALALLAKWPGYRYWLIFFGLFIFISGSLLGVIGYFFLLMFNWRSTFSLRFFLTFLAATFLLFWLFIYFGFNFESPLITRIFSIDSDESSSIRLFSPFYLMRENFLAGDILGTPINLYNKFFYTGLYQDGMALPVHNGLLSLVILFGAPGVAMLFYMLLINFNRNRFLIILVAGSQSGNLFSYEKVFIILYFLSLIGWFDLFKCNHGALYKKISHS